LRSRRKEKKQQRGGKKTLNREFVGRKNGEKKEKEGGRWKAVTETDRGQRKMSGKEGEGSHEWARGGIQQGRYRIIERGEHWEGNQREGVHARGEKNGEENIGDVGGVL